MIRLNCNKFSLRADSSLINFTHLGDSFFRHPRISATPSGHLVWVQELDLGRIRYRKAGIQPPAAEPAAFFRAEWWMVIWVVVSKIFYLNPCLGKIPNFDYSNIFQVGWNHQPVIKFLECCFRMIFVSCDLMLPLGLSSLFPWVLESKKNNNLLRVFTDSKVNCFLHWRS